MSYALMTSGGKDATVALDRARRQGLDVRFLAALYDGASGRVRFHGIRKQLLVAQAKCMGLELLVAPTLPDAFEPVFNDVLHRLRKRGAVGVILGNINLPDVHAWYAERIRAAGLEHVEPLWGEPAVEIAWEVIEHGYRAVITSVDLAQRAVPFLGREFDADVVTEISCMEGMDPCGERGEYHTFVFDGPDFAHPVGFTRGPTFEHEGHRFIDLIPLNGQVNGPGSDVR
jgi:uncharacterized protein (TIGR00290 family)